MTVDSTQPFYTRNPGTMYVNGRFYPGQLYGRLIDPPKPMRRGDSVLAANLLYFGYHGCVSACGMVIEWTMDAAPTVVLILPKKSVGTSPINADAALFTSIAANILPGADPRTVNWHTAADQRYRNGVPSRKSFEVFSPAVDWKRSLRTWNPIKLLIGGAWKWDASSHYGFNQLERGNRERAFALIEEYWPRIEGYYPHDMSSDYRDLFRTVYGTPEPQ